MDKLITFAIPCYNSGAFMHHCIDSLLGAGDDIEIIIVNDGSSDNTGEVADEYARKYPDIIRAVHQERRTWRRRQSGYERRPWNVL